jgi:hypothetical protein
MISITRGVDIKFKQRDEHPVVQELVLHAVFKYCIQSITTPALHVTNLVWGNATSDEKASQNAQDHFQIFFIWLYK